MVVQIKHKKNEVDFLLSLSHIKKKNVLCKSIETQEISGFASRQSGVGVEGAGAERNSQPQQLILK